MSTIYESCPSLKGPSLTLRLVAMEDAEDLLMVYGDPGNTPFFNADNCHGDNFYYPTLERMQQAISFWLHSYKHGWFVRWSIVERQTVIGTVECFYRGPSDAFGDSALLRIDLRRDRDTERINSEILDILLPCLKELFGGHIAVIKAPAIAQNRIAALTERGFSRSAEKLIGEGGTTYGDYWIREL